MEQIIISRGQHLYPTTCVSYAKKRKNDELREASSQGLQKIEEVTQVRKKLRDNKYRDAIDRLEIVLREEAARSLVWHKNCYAQFTDKGKLQRLQSQTQTLASHATASCSTGEHEPTKERPASTRLTKPIVDVLIPFHALTGSDSTSFFAGHSKKTEWKVFEQHCNLLSELGLGSLTNEMEDAAESFVCKKIWPV